MFHDKLSTTYKKSFKNGNLVELYKENICWVPPLQEKSWKEWNIYYRKKFGMVSIKWPRDPIVAKSFEIAWEFTFYDTSQ